MNDRTLLAPAKLTLSIGVAGVRDPNGRFGSEKFISLKLY